MANASQYGSFIPTTQIWDVSQIYATNLESPDALRELFVRMYQNLNLMATSLNTRDAGFYVKNEFVNGQIYFSNPNLSSQTDVAASPRQVYRKVIVMPALQNASPTTQAHGITITPSTTFTRIYGATTNNTQTSFLPLPYVAVTDPDGNIQLSVTNTDVIVSPAGNRSAYTTTYVIVEYLKV